METSTSGSDYQDQGRGASSLKKDSPKKEQTAKQSKAKEKDSASDGTENVEVQPVISGVLMEVLGKLDVVELNAEVPIDSIEPFDVRAGGSDKGKVLTYAQVMGEGAKFPNVILLRDARNTLRAGDGNHRIQAAILAGKSTIFADIYEGEVDDCIDVGLAANTHGANLKPQDVIRAITMKLNNDDKPNISELARKTGISRPTVRKYLEQAKLGYSGLARRIKVPKTDEQKADDLAVKVARIIEDGGMYVMPGIFKKLSPYLRNKAWECLRDEFPDEFTAK